LLIIFIIVEDIPWTASLYLPILGVWPTYFLNLKKPLPKGLKLYEQSLGCLKKLWLWKLELTERTPVR